jgi:hypothetical protein
MLVLLYIFRIAMKMVITMGGLADRFFCSGALQVYPSLLINGYYGTSTCNRD